MKLPFLAASLFAGLFAISSASAAIQVFSSSHVVTAGGPVATWKAQNQEHSLGPGPNPTPGMSAYIGTTIEIDTETSMIRAYGSSGPFSFSWSGSDTITWQTGTIPPVFPNPYPTPVYDSAEIDVTITIDVATFSFDTGFQPFAWNGSQYAFAGSFNAVTTGNVTVGHSVTRGSETSSGSAQFLNIPINVFGGATYIITDYYPNSLSLGGANMRILPGFDGEILVQSLGSHTFSDGFTYSAYAIPEPTAALLGCLSLLVLPRRRRK